MHRYRGSPAGTGEEDSHRPSERASGERGISTTARLAVATLLTFGFAIAEAIGGWITGSLALLADAVHMTADGAALVLALAAAWLSARPHSRQATYGFHRAEVLAALANAIVLGVLVTRIAWEAITRLIAPQPFDAWNMSWIAALGLGVNLLVLWVLGHRTHAASHALNLRAATLHVIGDLLGSLTALVAGLTSIVWGWQRTDPVASLLVAILVGISSWRIVRESAWVLLEAAPADMDLDAVHQSLATLDGVIGVDDLHVWCVTPGRVALSVHLRLASDADAARYLRVVERANQLLAERFQIRHTTIQIDRVPGSSQMRPLGASPMSREEGA
jgi:cobalt-zinc-cadmium efflux system protein